MTEWIARLLQDPDLLRMGHWQRAADNNLGMGWLYYGLVRLLRPRLAVVIGSYRGFVPLVLGKAVADNLEGGQVWFIDPSLVDDFWKDPQRVREHFDRHGVSTVRHFPMTTQEFVSTDEYHRLAGVGLVFIDGYHTAEQAGFDFEAFAERLAPGGLVLFHDSLSTANCRLYGPERVYQRGVNGYLDQLRQQPRWQVFDLPFDPGLTLVRKADNGLLRTGGGNVLAP